MYDSPNILLYADNDDDFRRNAHSLIAECGIPFIEISSITHLFSAVKKDSGHIIMVATRDLIDIIINLYTTNECKSHVFFVCNFKEAINLPPNKQVKYGDFNNLRDYLISNIKVKNINMKFQPQTPLSKLLRTELENIDISKKYTGFKYIVDLITHWFKNKVINTYSNDLFKEIASINTTTYDIVERDIRHMLVTTWKNSPKFRTAILPNKQTKSTLPAKQILNGLICYLQKII